MVAASPRTAGPVTALAGPAAAMASMVARANGMAARNTVFLTEPHPRPQLHHGGVQQGSHVTAG